MAKFGVMENSPTYHVRIAIVLLLMCATELAIGAGQSEAMPETCMTRWLRLARPSDGSAAIQAREDLMSRATPALDESTIPSTDPLTVKLYQGGSAAAARYLAQCMSDGGPRCPADRPCLNAGKCLYQRTPTAGYTCQCRPGFTGQFCSTAVSRCTPGRCHNGGTCIPSHNGYRCLCRTLFNGRRCEKRWLSASIFTNLTSTLHQITRDVARNGRNDALVKQDVADQVSEFLSNVGRQVNASLLKVQREQTAALQSVQRNVEELQQCSPASLGFAYTTHTRTSGGLQQLASIQFTKKRASTLLRITYSTTIRTQGGSPGSIWFAKIDGQECTQPSRISIIHFRRDADDVHIPGYLEGLCRATSSGPIAQGRHVITIHTGRLPPSYNHGAHSGWAAPSLLQVREICDQ
eukprot:scpid65916/ scgid4903/ Neurogenic locus Notch protein; Processed neurogenic locus Notch protein